MKIMDKMWGSLGLLEPVEAEEDKAALEDAEPRGKKGGNLVNLPAPNAQKQIKVMVVEPFSFDDAQHIADHLKNRKPVVVNLENTDKEIAKRMVDFISGTTYALSGTIQKVGNHIFLCAPSNVDVNCATREDNADKAQFPWVK